MEDWQSQECQPRVEYSRFDVDWKQFKILICMQELADSAELEISLNHDQEIPRF